MNNFDEIWSRWEPNPDLKASYDIIDIKDNIDYLKILIGSTKCDQKIEVVFDSSWAHRNTYETFRMNLVSQLSKKYGSDFYVNWSFFKINNSSYLKWLSEQSCSYTDRLNLNHFVIMGNDFIVDIVASEEPEIKILPSKEIKEKFTNIITMKKNGLLNQRNYSKDGQSITELFDSSISTKTRGNKTE